MKIRRILSVFLLSVLLCSQLVTPAAAVEHVEVNAKSALLVDTAGDVILYEKEAYKTVYPASITKVMTALVVLDAIEAGKLRMDQVVTASEGAFFDMEPDGSTAGIKAGESMSVKDLIYCMMLVSANEACNILAEAVCGVGNIKDFITLMNTKAAQLGMNNTHYVNTSGLHHADHYTTAWDIYLLAKEALKSETLMTVCNTLAYDVPPTNMAGSRELHTTNSLISNWRILGYLYDGAEGIKTGTTEEAGNCLLSSAVRSGRRLVCVVLGCDGSGDVIESYSDSARLYDYGFYNFSMRTVLTEDELIREVPVALSKETNYVVVHPATSIQTILPNDIDVSPTSKDLKRTVTLTTDVAHAPIATGDVLGEITITYGDQVCGKVPLLAQYDVSASKFLTAKYQLIQFLSKTIVQVSIAVLVVLILLFWIWWKFLRRKRRYGKSGGGRHHHRSYRGKRR